jgi:SAM-dependent methyltransferase
MQAKPEHSNSYYAEAFKDHQVVDAYRNRPPYPPEVFTILADLITDTPRTVLDVGAGSGDIARQLVGNTERVDAVDFSENMIARGKQLPNGNDPRLHWIYGKVEDVPLSPPYALITAGSSIHWPEWSIAFPRFQAMLSPNGFLALIYRRTLPMPWDNDLKQLRYQFSTRHYRQHHPAYHAVEELESRGFFAKHGEKETAPIPFPQSIDDFIDGLHSRSGFARERMGQQQAIEFDQLAKVLLSPFATDGILPLQVIGTITWGKPKTGKPPE